MQVPNSSTYFIEKIILSGGVMPKFLTLRGWMCRMLRLWRRYEWTVKKVSGDTRIWTMDLSDCSRLLYHWAISPRGDNVFRRERQVAMMSWFQSHLAAKKSYGAMRLKVLQYSDLPVSVGGIMVSIAAFQAVDPGSIPGRRILFCAKFKNWIKKFCPCRDQDSNLGYCGHNAGS